MNAKVLTIDMPEVVVRVRIEIDETYGRVHTLCSLLGQVLELRTSKYPELTALDRVMDNPLTQCFYFRSDKIKGMFRWIDNRGGFVSEGPFEVEGWTP